MVSIVTQILGSMWILPLLLSLLFTSDWWSGLMEHSILSTQWWGSVLQGSVGSAITLLGVFLVIRHELRRDERARRHEQERETEARRLEQEKESRSRTYESFVSFNTLCTRLMYDIQESQRPTVELAEQMFELLVVEGPEHLGLQNWILAHQDYVVECGTHPKQRELISGAAAYLSGALSAWVLRGCPDDFFEVETVALFWRKNCKDAGVEPFVPRSVVRAQPETA